VSNPLLTNRAEDRVAVITIGAGIALHGLLAGGATPNVAVVREAFDLATQFVEEAERRAIAAGVKP
jgi:hypothetical protein